MMMKLCNSYCCSFLEKHIDFEWQDNQVVIKIPHPILVYHIPNNEIMMTLFEALYDFTESEQFVKHRKKYLKKIKDDLKKEMEVLKKVDR